MLAAARRRLLRGTQRHQLGPRHHITGATAADRGSTSLTGNRVWSDTISMNPDGVLHEVAERRHQLAPVTDNGRTIWHVEHLDASPGRGTR